MLQIHETGLRNWDRRELAVCTDGKSWWLAALAENARYVGACSHSVTTKTAALELARFEAARA